MVIQNENVERSIGNLEGMMSGMLTSLSQIHNDLKALRDDFNTMERGRLTRLEVAFNTLQTEIEVKAKSVATYRSVLASIVAATVSGTILYFLLE